MALSHAHVVTSFEKIQADNGTHDHVCRIEGRLIREAFTSVKIVILSNVEINAYELQTKLQEADDSKGVKAPDILTDKRLYTLLLTKEICECQHLHAVEHKPQIITYGIEQSLRIYYAYRVKDYDYQQVIVRRQDLYITELYDAKQKEEHYRKRYELGYSYRQSCHLEREYNIT